MSDDAALQQPATRPKVKWLKWVIVLLVIEKIIQHTTVTLAFYFDWGGIRNTVAIPADILMVLGGIVAILFAVALWGVLTRRPWTRGLIMGLAIFDMVGEFVAQGKIDITLNVSFLVAAILFLLCLRYREPGGARSS